MPWKMGPNLCSQPYRLSPFDNPFFFCNFLMLHFQEPFTHGQAKSCLFLLKFILNQFKVDYGHVEKSSFHHREEYILVALKKFSKDRKAIVNLFIHVHSTLSSIIFKYTFWFDYVFFFNFLMLPRFLLSPSSYCAHTLHRTIF